MRLDKYISQNASISRSLAKKAISSGQVSINDLYIKNPAFKVSSHDKVLFSDKQITKLGHRYLMLNKPVGYICSTKDDIYPSVLNLIDIEKHDSLHIVGRLDVDTTGLVFITDDGQWSHRISSPKTNCPKTYRVDLTESIDTEIIEIFAKGLLLKNEIKPTLPAKLIIESKNRALLSIQEGRYHQVKRMFAAVSNHVTSLHRLSIGKVILDPQLNNGEWRHLNAAEVSSFIVSVR